MYLLFMLPALVIATLAQLYVSYAFSKWKSARFHMTGREVAERIVSGRAPGVSVELSSGFLSDHYDPARRTIRLSPQVYHGNSVSSAAVAAHEAGHAMQHYESYFPLRIRSAIVPLVSIGSQLAWIFIFAGLVLKLAGLAILGLFLFSFSVLFSLITLPVEIDASRRAMEEMERMGVSGETKDGMKEVLTAAALTYVAALFSALMNFLYYLMIVAGMRDE